MLQATHVFVSIARLGAVALALGAGYYLVTTAHREANPPEPAPAADTNPEEGHGSRPINPGSGPLADQPKPVATPHPTSAQYLSGTKAMAPDSFLHSSKSIAPFLQPEQPAENQPTPTGLPSPSSNPRFLSTSKSLVVERRDWQRPTENTDANGSPKPNAGNTERSKESKAKPRFLPTSKSLVIEPRDWGATKEPAATKPRFLPSSKSGVLRPGDWQLPRRLPNPPAPVSVPKASAGQTSQPASRPSDPEAGRKAKASSKQTGKQQSVQRKQ